MADIGQQPTDPPPPTVAGTLAEILVQMRRDLGLSQPEAADALGMPAPTLRGIESGRGFRYPMMLLLAMAALYRDATDGNRTIIGELYDPVTGRSSRC